jgi:cell envelope-related function transcriptional attenuator common domain
MEKKEMKEKKKFKLSKKTIIITAIVACLLIPVIAYGSYMAYILYFRETPTIVNTDDELIQGDDPAANLPAEETSGIDNIVLFGVDSRTPTDHGRTDSIIIATVDKNAKVVKLTSIMRDMYVKIGSTSSMNRINAAYSFGGPELALKTLNNIFGLDLKYYALIDFKAFQELVDKVGGIDVDVKDYEVKEINYYIQSVNGASATLLTGPGFQHLNGQQALSFARIRKVGNGDYERTERQRLVLKCVADKVKQVNILKIPQFLTTLASYAQTNVPIQKIISLGITAYKFNSSVETMRVPVDGYFQPQDVNGASVLVPDIAANAQFVREFIYNVKTVGNKDMPSYMKNNFHADDSAASAKPKPNIPDYSTPSIPLKPEEEQQPTPTPTQTGTPTGTTAPTGTTGTPTGTATPTTTPTPTPTKPTGTPATQ